MMPSARVETRVESSRIPARQRNNAACVRVTTRQLPVGGARECLSESGRDRQTDRDRERQRETHTERHTERDRSREAERQRKRQQQRQKQRRARRLPVPKARAHKRPLELQPSSAVVLQGDAGRDAATVRL